MKRDSATNGVGVRGKQRLSLSQLMLDKVIEDSGILEVRSIR